MTSSKRVEVRLLSEEAFAAALAAEITDAGGGIQLEAVELQKDSSSLGFDLGTIAAVIAVVQGLAVDGPLVPALLRALRREKPRKIVISTPFSTITYEPTESPTEEEVRQVVTRLVEATG